MDVWANLETLLALADAEAGDASIAPPLHPTVPFAGSSAQAFGEMSSQARHPRFYRRYGSPTQARLERVVAALEGAEDGLATASGMAALSTALWSLLAAGDHVVGQRSMYGGTLELLSTTLPRMGIDSTLVDQTDSESFAQAVTARTKVFVLETPSNPLLRLTDVAAVAALARRHGIVTLVDATIATPVHQRPLEQGADLVVHSMTKALSGHSDVLAGIVLGSAELIERVWRTHLVLGGVISPFDAWLALRGLRTLPLRVQRQDQTALAVAQFLADHDAVEAVHYPGLATHPQHGLARRQMRGFGGLLSFQLHGGYEAAEACLDRLKIPARAPSLGGFRSLVVQPAAMWTQSLDADQLSAAGIPPGLLRLAVGLEAAADLIADLRQALSGAAAAST